MYCIDEVKEEVKDEISMNLSPEVSLFYVSSLICCHENERPTSFVALIQ